MREAEARCTAAHSDGWSCAALTAWRLRLASCAQVVHARIAMLAALGWVVQERWHPLFGGDIEGEHETDR